jgi:hypothetical protein
MIISGSILIGLGSLMALGSIPLWIDGLDLDSASTDGRSAGDEVSINAATALDAIGVSMLIAGAVLLPIGLVRRRASRTTRTALIPRLSFSSDSVSAGFSYVF